MCGIAQATQAKVERRPASGVGARRKVPCVWYPFQVHEIGACGSRRIHDAGAQFFWRSSNQAVPYR